MPLSRPFISGLNPRRIAAARQEVLQSRRFAMVAKDAPTPPPAWSLADKRLRSLEQGQAGTCWLHAAVQMAEIMANGHGYDIFAVCRRLVGWVGKSSFEGGGNPSDGGSGLDAIRAMTTDGAGLAHESMCAYTDDYRTLGTKPDDAVFADASKSHLTMPIQIRERAEWMTLISNGFPVCIGIYWPRNWDDQQPIMDQIGLLVGGHEVLVMGYFQYQGQLHWIIDNWHGKTLYPTLPADTAQTIPGFKPFSATRTSEFAVPDSVLARLIAVSGPMFEMNAATDAVGLSSKIVTTDWSDVLPS